MNDAEATVTATETAESADGGEAVGIPSLMEAVGELAAALGQAQTVARETRRAGPGIHPHRIGTLVVAPAKGDRRFNDPAWTSNPAFRMIQQSYLASAEALDRIVDELGDGGTTPGRSRLASRPTS